MAYSLTEAQRAEYNTLTYDQQRRYDFERSIDPSLTHDQAIVMVGLDINLKKGLLEGGTNVKPGPDFYQKVIQGVNDFLKYRFPRILAQVQSTIDKALDYLGDLIWRGIEWVDDIVTTIKDFFD